MVAASYDGAIRVYETDARGEPCAVFKRHTDDVSDVAQLDKDVVASVGDDCRLFAWRAATAQCVGEWKSFAKLRSVVKLNESKIIVGMVVVT